MFIIFVCYNTSKRKEINADMSGIFGVVSANSIDEHKYANISKWNSSYGDQNERRYLDNHALLGIKAEKLKEYDYEDDDCILKYDEKFGVADSLIFSSVPDGISDELFLHTSVCKDGMKSLEKINGDFVGAIWDVKKMELTLYRDHVGVRPLFYYKDDAKVVFSSDIRGITSLYGVDTSIDERWIYYTTVNVYAPTPVDTEYQYIKCVPPGGYIKFSLSNNVIKSSEGRYWIPGQNKIKMKNREEYTQELRRLVEDAVRIRADATKMSLGAELSGGLDSGVIDILLAKMGKECFYYSWSPSKEVVPYAKDDERLIIDDICEITGIKCNYGGINFDLSEHKQIRERSPLFFDEECEKYNFPYKYAFPPYFNTPEIYETAAVMQEHGVKFVFTGHGGDEGISHRANPYEMFYHHEYYRYLRTFFSRSSIYKHRIIGTAKLIAENQKIAREILLKPVENSKGGSSILNKDFVERLKPEGQPFLFAYDPKTYIRKGGGIRNRLDVLAFYSACTGVRYLAPYVDYRVIDFALGIPRYLYHNWHYTRYIFREAFKDIIPRSLYYLSIKESHSYDNLPKPDENEQKGIEESEKKRRKELMIKGRKELLSNLDKAYWQKYFDYDALEEWANAESNPDYDKAINDAVCQCLLAEFMVKRSKELRQN